MDFIKNNKRYFITIAVGLVMAAWIFFTRDIPPVEGHNMTFHILSEALFVPGVFIFAAGILMWVSNEGVFNGVSYGLQALWKAFTDRKNPKMQESYYDYHIRKTGKKVRFGHLLIVGSVFLVLSIICVVMVY